MKILILGGTGAMGTHLCKILATGGGEIVVSSRKQRRDEANVTFVKGDAHDTDFLKSLLSHERWDAIVDFMVYSTLEFKQRVNLFLSNTNQYIFLSSSRVYAESEEPLTEESPRILDVCIDKEYLSTDEYALSKARQEDILKSCGKTNWTIIRPYVTYSEIRLQLSPSEKEYWLQDALSGRSILFSRDLSERYTTLTYGYDVARSIAALIGQKGALGEAFHITVGESHKWSEILDNYLDVIEKVTGQRPKVEMLEEWEPIIGGSETQVKWDRLYNRRFNNSKINKYIDTTTFKKTMPTMAECLASFLRQPRFLSQNVVNNALRDRRENRWTNLKEIKGAKQKLKYLLARLGLYF